MVQMHMYKNIHEVCCQRHNTSISAVCKQAQLQGSKPNYTHLNSEFIFVCAHTESGFEKGGIFLVLLLIHIKHKTFGFLF